MVALIMFWAAVLALLFFLLEIILRGLSSAFEGAVSSAITILCIAFVIGIAVCALYLVYIIVGSFMNNDIWDAVLNLFLFILCILFAAGLLGGIGGSILAILLPVLEMVFMVICLVLDTLAEWCKRANGYFFSVISKNIDKC